MIYNLYTNGNAEVWVEFGVDVTLPASAMSIGQPEKVVVAEPSFSLAEGTPDLGSGSAQFSLADGALDLTPSVLEAPVGTGAVLRELMPQPVGVFELYEPAGLLEASLLQLDSLVDNDVFLWDLHSQDAAWIDGVAVLQYEA